MKNKQEEYNELRQYEQELNEQLFRESNAADMTPERANADITGNNLSCVRRERSILGRELGIEE